MTSTSTPKPIQRGIIIPNIINGVIPVWRGAAVSPSRPKQTPITVPNHYLILPDDEDEERPVWGVAVADDVPKVVAGSAPVVPTRLPKRKSTTVPPLLRRRMAK